MSEIIKPKVLKEGSMIGVAAVSSAFDKEMFYEGVEVLKSLGFRVRFSEGIFRKQGYLAGSDEERAGELNGLLADPDLSAIMFARGGYGVQRIMPLVDFSAFKENPKVVIGFSDLTPLIGYITSHLNIAAFYGPSVTTLAGDVNAEGSPLPNRNRIGEGDNCLPHHNASTVSSLNKAITSTKPLGKVGESLVVVKEGEAKGRLIGGCLSLITSSIGTKYELKSAGGILFIEDNIEKVYRYDRMLTQVKNAGLLRDVSGIVFGSMGIPESEKSPESIWPVIESILHDFPGPIVSGLSSGHTSPFTTLPFGVDCKLIAKKGAELIFEEPALV